MNNPLLKIALMDIVYFQSICICISIVVRSLYRVFSKFLNKSIPYQVRSLSVIAHLAMHSQERDQEEEEEVFQESN